MTEWWAFKPVTTAFEKTKKLLLQPFDLWTWIKLIVIVFFVGGASRFSSQANNVFNYRTSGSDTYVYGQMIDRILTDSTLLMFLIGVVVAIVILALIFAYLRNVFSFVLIRALTTGDVHLIKPAKENLSRGFRLFIFTVLLGLLTLAVAVVLIVAMIVCLVIAINTGVASAGAILLVALLAMIILILLALLIAFSIVMSIVTGFTYDFVAPMMLFKGMGVMEAWRYLYALIKREWKQFGVYVLMRWVLELAIGIIVMIISLPVILVFIALFIVGVLMAVAAAKTSVLLAALVGLGILAGVVLFVAILVVISMPVAIYLRYYSLDVLKTADPSAVEYMGKMGTP